VLPGLRAPVLAERLDHHDENFLMVGVPVCAGGRQVKTGVPLRPPRGPEGLRLSSAGLASDSLGVPWREGQPRPRWARLCPCPDTAPHLSAARSAPEAVWHAPASGPELTANAHDGALCAGAIFLPLELRSSSRG